MSNHDMQGNGYMSVAKFRQEGVHDWQSEEGSTDATNLAAIIDAQTSATLALAYEQARAADEARTANLLALHAQPGLAIDYDTLRDRIIGRLNLA